MFSNAKATQRDDGQPCNLNSNARIFSVCRAYWVDQRDVPVGDDVIRGLDRRSHRQATTLPPVTVESPTQRAGPHVLRAPRRAAPERSPHAAMPIRRPPRRHRPSALSLPPPPNTNRSSAIVRCPMRQPYAAPRRSSTIAGCQRRRSRRSGIRGRAIWTTRWSKYIRHYPDQYARRHPGCRDAPRLRRTTATARSCATACRWCRPHSPPASKASRS